MINENVNLAFSFLVSTNVRLIKDINYNKIIKRFAQVGGGTGKKITEKMAENVSKIPTNKVKLSNQNIKNKNPHWKKPSLKKNNNYKDNNNNKKFTDIKQKNNKEFTFQKKNTVQKNKNTFEDLVKKHPIDHEHGNLKKNATDFKNNNNIPTPPPLPKNPITPTPIKKIEVEIICPETLKAAKKNLVCQYNIPSLTNITANNLTEQEVIIEGLSRGLLKKDEEPTKTEKFITIDNETISTIDGQYNIKLTQLGQAHYKEINNNKEISSHGIGKYNTNDYEYKLGIIQDTSTDVLITSGKETHIVTIIIVNKKNQETYIMGILTSKKTGEEISPIQYIEYQNQKQIEINKNDIEKKKTQKYQESEHFEWIDKNKIKFLKWGEEYINNTALKDILPTQHNRIYSNGGKFINSGITKNNIIEICLNFDKKIKNKEPQPKTKEQILQQIKGVEKQKKILEEKEEIKLKKNIYDDDENI